VEPRNTQFIPRDEGRAGSFQSSGANSDGGGRAESFLSGFTNIWNKIPAESYKLLGLLALIVAFLLYILVFSLIPGRIYYLWAQIITLVVVLFTLWGFNKIKDGDSPVGKALVIFIFMFFIYNVTTHDYVEIEKTDSNQATIQQSQAPLVASGPGSYNLGILKNQKKLVRLPSCSHYNFNKTATLIVETKDGQIINSWEPGAWPLASELLVTNLSDTTITLIVTR